MASLGWRPTFDGRDLVLEVHLFDYEADLYGQWLCCAFVERLRDEERFESVEALRIQMARDCIQARTVLATLGGLATLWSWTDKARGRRAMALGHGGFLDSPAADSYLRAMRAQLPERRITGPVLARDRDGIVFASLPGSLPVTVFAEPLSSSCPTPRPTRRRAGPAARPV